MPVPAQQDDPLVRAQRDCSLINILAKTRCAPTYPRLPFTALFRIINPSMKNPLLRLYLWAKMGPPRDLLQLVLALPYFGKGMQCPVCGFSFRRMRPFGHPRHGDTRCPYCGAKARWRFAWLFLNRRTDLFDGRPKSMLHFAPERCFVPRFKKRLKGRYLTADLYNPFAMQKIDVTTIPFPAASFDAIFCSHVLEHVEDDRKAMSEFQRILKPGGWALLQVPVTPGTTFEDPSITDPVAREKLFGEPGHVRRYGLDIARRLEEAGFKVTVFRVSDLVDEYEAARLGLTPAGGEIFYCQKG
jgi:SAM-dependent methyltransferase